jgi:DUF218 domain
MATTPSLSSEANFVPSEAVIVCCHAIFHGQDPRNEDHWALQPFQKGSGEKPGEHLTFLEHIQEALKHRQQTNGAAQIIFSGGRTKNDFPELSEARSYMDAARKLRWIRDEHEVLLEELATDSYQNVAFSILSFRRTHGLYPSKLTVVTHDFKRDRFMDLHRKALRWPKESYSVLGVPLPLTGMKIVFLQHNFHYRIFR